MRLIATLLLAAMAVIFIVCLIYPRAHPAVPWIMAFSEAAMVGGLAERKKKWV